MDHYEDSEGDDSRCASMEFTMDSAWLDSLKVGARYADRKQTVRWGTYNWPNIANTWCQNSYYNIDNTRAAPSPLPATSPATHITAIRMSVRNRAFNSDSMAAAMLRRTITSSPRSRHPAEPAAIAGLGLGYLGRGLEPDLLDVRETALTKTPDCYTAGGNPEISRKRRMRPTAAEIWRRRRSRLSACRYREISACAM